MKIVAVSNHDDEMVSDSLICENVNERNGKRLVELLNQPVGNDSMYFHKLEADDYKLYVWNPNE